MFRRLLWTCLAVVLAHGIATTAMAQAQTERRIALVIGNGAYQAGALATAANDAGLIAQTLEASGFDVVGARDLDQDSLRQALRDFMQKAQQAGPNTVAFIYFSGYGLQLEGENYIVPVDAVIANDTQVAANAVRVSDYVRPLAGLKLKALIVVLDAARPNTFAAEGPPLAGGLALMEPDDGMLIAFSSAPGTVAPDMPGHYGAYAQALAEMMREGGLPLSDVFDRVRLRVNDLTKGGQIPWHASRITAPFVFFERAADAPASVAAVDQAPARRTRPIREFDEKEAYIAALERDTLPAYLDFLDAYPDSVYASRVRAIVAARREAITWRRTRALDTPAAYWSYLRRYPDGPHAADARRRLAILTAPPEPPPTFTVVEYDVPPPPPDEIIYVRRPVLIFSDPVYAFAPPPPVPVVFLEPPPPAFVAIVAAPPPPPVGLFLLPMPVYHPVPLWVRPPMYVAAPPPNNVIYNNVHNTVIINNNTRRMTIRDPRGRTRTVALTGGPAGRGARGPGRPGAAGAVGLVGPALPASVARKAALTPAPGKPGAAATGAPRAPDRPSSAPPTAVQPAARPATGQPLPGAQGARTPATTAAKPGVKPGAGATSPSPPAPTTPAAAARQPAGTPSTAPAARPGATQPSPPSGVAARPPAPRPGTSATAPQPGKVTPPPAATSPAPKQTAPKQTVRPPAPAARQPPPLPPRVTAPPPPRAAVAPPPRAAAPPPRAAAPPPPRRPTPPPTAARPTCPPGKQATAQGCR
jgi:uncharacterized caspase-like protein